MVGCVHPCALQVCLLLVHSGQLRCLVSAATAWCWRGLCFKVKAAQLWRGCKVHVAELCLSQVCFRPGRRRLFTRRSPGNRAGGRGERGVDRVAEQLAQVSLDALYCWGEGDGG